MEENDPDEDGWLVFSVEQGGDDGSKTKCIG